MSAGAIVEVGALLAILFALVGREIWFVIQTIRGRE
jgi:hypothetical protein